MSYPDLPTMSSVDDLASYDPSLWDDPADATAASHDTEPPAKDDTPAAAPAPHDEGPGATARVATGQRFPLPEVVVDVPPPAKETGDTALDELLYAGLDLDPEAPPVDGKGDGEGGGDTLLVPPEWDTPPLLASLGTGPRISDDELLALAGNSPRVGQPAGPAKSPGDTAPKDTAPNDTAPTDRDPVAIGDGTALAMADAQKIADEGKEKAAVLKSRGLKLYLPGTPETEDPRRQLAALNGRTGDDGFSQGLLP